MASLRQSVEANLAKDRARREQDGALLLDEGARFAHHPSPADLDAAFRAAPLKDRKALLRPLDVVLALLGGASEALQLQQEKGLPGADNLPAWEAIARAELPRPVAKALATTLAERGLERGCAAAFSGGSEEEQGRWFRDPSSAAQQAAAVCARSDAVYFAGPVVAWHLLVRVLPRQALVAQGAIFLVCEAEVVYDRWDKARRKRAAQAALRQDPLDASALTESAAADAALAALPQRAAKGAQLFVVGLAVNTVLPSALALVAPSWGSYLGCLLSPAVAGLLPLDFLASALLAFAGQ